MRIVLLITALEGLVLASWLLMRRHYKNLPPTATTVSTGRSLVAVDAVGPPRNAARWSFINASQAEGQAGDRSPMLSSVAATTGSPAAHRSSARRSHQLHFKKWSTERHD